MSTVDQIRQGSTLVLTINNPPVNAFSPGVPEGLHAGLDAAEQDQSIEGGGHHRRRAHLYRRGRHQDL